MSATRTPRPWPVIAAEQLAAERAGGDFHYTRAVEGRKPGEWHVPCPACRQATVTVRGDEGLDGLVCRPWGDTSPCEPTMIAVALAEGLASTNGDKPQDDTPGPTSWAPVDLRPVLEGKQTDPGPTMLARDDDVCLLYPAKVHQAAGEPESGKGWLALHAVAGVLDAGGCAAYFDLEDDELTVTARLRALGCEDDAIADRLAYVRPHEPLDGRGRTDLDQVLERKPQLAVIDGVTEALTLLGLDLGDNADIARWLELLPRRIVRAGARCC